MHTVYVPLLRIKFNAKYEKSELSSIFLCAHSIFALFPFVCEYHSWSGLVPISFMCLPQHLHLHKTGYHGFDTLGGVQLVPLSEQGVAKITPIGNVKSRAKMQANNTPHHGSCSCLSNPSQVNMESAMTKTKRT
ncbi:hypothetical protein IEQ34_026984 [Dendrobium chrysotoxum]|uniref:Uncharacterized protein n=1 Tax=Dendrobium chrysotoxum TaxID=161865 RepID=A0AAV7FIF2_DENCH|nr:hypothetical protein IEQ34_026984 [Dendrobium chrysotoxum]